MKDQNKTKKQLNELMELRQRTAELEKLEGEHRKAEKSLKESEKRYRRLYDDAPVGYHEYDKEGRITDVNRTDLEMLGYTREEMVGEFIWKFHIEEEIAHQQILAKLSGTLPPGRSLERTYRRKDGTTFPLCLKIDLFGMSKDRSRVSVAPFRTLRSASKWRRRW